MESRNRITTDGAQAVIELLAVKLARTDALLQIQTPAAFRNEPRVTKQRQRNEEATQQARQFINSH